jgi:hypothetical protein
MSVRQAKAQEAIRLACQVLSWKFEALTPAYPNILARISGSDALIVDVTSGDPSVTHDLGVAHGLGVPVLCVCRSGHNPHLADLEGLRVTYYDNIVTDSAAFSTFVRILQSRLLKCVGPVDDGVWITDSFEQRTRWITDDFKKLAGEKDAEPHTVWFSGFLSDFAMHPESLHEDEAYENELMAQRKALEDLVDRGFRMVCILSLPAARGLLFDTLHTVEVRLKHLLRFVAKDKDGETGSKRRIKWIVSPYRQKNFYIIGGISCIERFQKATSRGVDLSLRLTNYAAIHAHTTAYETLLEKLTSAFNLASRGDENATLRSLRNKTLISIKEAMTSYLEFLTLRLTDERAIQTNPKWYCERLDKVVSALCPPEQSMEDKELLVFLPRQHLNRLTETLRRVKAAQRRQ